MRIRKNTYFLSFINIFQTPKYWCDFFKNKRPLGLMATLFIIDLFNLVASVKLNNELYSLDYLHSVWSKWLPT